MSDHDGRERFWFKCFLISILITITTMSPDYVLSKRLADIRSQIITSDEGQTFDTLQFNITELFTHIWKSRYHPQEEVNNATKLNREIQSLVESAVWKADASIERLQVLNMTSSEIGYANMHEATSSILGWTQEFAVALQNSTSLIEHELSRSKDDVNGTFWKTLQKGVSGLTDKLQDQKVNAFDAHLQEPGKNLETVVTIDDHHEGSKMIQRYEKEPALNIMDTKSNKYVLSHPSGIKFLVAHSEDSSLIIDFVLVLLLGYLLSLLFELIGLPGFFGNIMAGIILGPSFLDIINNIVQISSIGQIGALILLLELGLEFSVPKLFKYSRITIFGTTAFSLLCSGAWGIFGKFALGSGFAESCFIGFMISFASTAVSIKCLDQVSTTSLNQFIKETNTENIITGILLMQDALFSTIISILPMLTTLSNEGPFNGAIELFKFLFKTFITASVTFVLAKYVASALFSRSSANPDIIKLLTAFGSLMICNQMGISYEFGAFFTGLSFSLLNTKEEGRVEVLPLLREFFCTIFFVSLGLFIDIQFVKGEFLILIMAAIIAIFMKTLIMFGLCSGPLGLGTFQSMLLSVNLSQVSELSMALGSKGRRLGIISREVYLLFVGSTILSLVVVPILWKAILSTTPKNPDMQELQTSP